MKDYTYDEFGNLEENETEGFLNETTYTGSVKDKNTGLQYMNSRYYDAKTGRFISQDTYSGNVYEPWTQHLYSYCGNNPTSMIDPTGHSFISLLFKVFRKQIEKAAKAYTNIIFGGSSRDKSVASKTTGNAGGNRRLSSKGSASKGSISGKNIKALEFDNYLIKAGYQRVDVTTTLTAEEVINDFVIPQIRDEGMQKWAVASGASLAVSEVFGWIGVAVLAWQTADYISDDTFLRQNGGGVMVEYYQSEFDTRNIGQSIYYGGTKRTAKVIYGKNGDVTYLQANVEVVETVYGADTLANGKNTDGGNWDNTQQLIQGFMSNNYY